MTTTTTLPGGEVVVPMSTLLDALASVLSEEERLKLFGELLNLRPARVAPGDLITADLFNRMLDDINDLMLRVAMLEANADTTQIPPRIVSISPSIVRSGEEITVSGQGLAAVNLQSLRFDNVPVPIGAIKPGSTQTRLVIDTPALIGLPTQGKAVVLSLANGAGAAQGSYTQLPGLADKLQSAISFVQKGISPAGKIAANSDYILTVEATIAASADETFDVISAIDGTGFVVTKVEPTSIDVAQASAVTPEKHTIKLTVHTPASGSGKLTLSLKGRHYADATGAMVPDVDFVIDAVTELPSDKIVFGVPTVDGPHGITLPPASAQPEILIFRGAAASPAKLTLPVTLVEGGKMLVSNLAVTAPGQWQTTMLTDLNVALNAGVGGELALTVAPVLSGGQPVSLTGAIAFDVTNAAGTQKRSFAAAIKVLG